ncbi:MAG: hypothetical protein R2865_03770 [Deinococcales bacterium]
MSQSLKVGKIITLGRLDTFAEGTAVKTVGKLNFDICQRHLDDIKIVETGHVCTELIDLYQNEGIIAEPSGAIPLAP